MQDCHLNQECVSPKKGVKGSREVSQLTGKCDGYEESVRRCGKV